MTSVKSLLCLCIVSVCFVGIASEDVVVAVTTFDDEEPEQEYVVEQEEPVNPFKNVNFANVPQYKYKPPNNQVHYVRPMQKPPQINYKPVQGYRRLPNKAEERKIKFVKMIKKKKKKKYKKLKKYLKNCGYPNHFKFKATKHADDEGDEYDTVKIGFMNDDHYYRRMMRRDDKGNVTKTDEKEKNSSEEGDDEDDEDDDVIFEELEDELEDKKPSPIPMFHPLMPRPYFPMNPMMPHQFPRPMFPPGPPPPPPPPPGFSMYRPRYPPPKPLGPAPIMRHPNLPLPHLPPQMPHTHQQMPLPHAQMVPHTQMVHLPPHMVPFGPPRVLPRPTTWKNQLKKRIPLTNPDLVSEETIVEEKIKDNKVRKPVVRIRPVQRAQFEVRNSTDELTTITTSPKTIYITTSAPLGYGLDKSSNSKYETFKFSYGFSPSHTAFSNPNTYNIKYSQPDYSMFGTYESTTTMKPTEPEKVVTVTPVSVWEGQPIFAAETTTTTRTVSNNTRKMHLRRMQKPDDRKDTEEETTHSWVPLRIKPTSKMSSRFKKSENFVTYPTVDRQQVKPLLPRPQETGSNMETQHENSDIITAKYPLDDINNLHLNMHNPNNDSRPFKPSKELKPFIITKENMNQFGFSKRMVYFNVAEGIKKNDNDKLGDIPRDNSGVGNVSQYVTESPSRTKPV